MVPSQQVVVLVGLGVQEPQPPVAFSRSSFARRTAPHHLAQDPSIWRVAAPDRSRLSFMAWVMHEPAEDFRMAGRGDVEFILRDGR